MKTPGSRNEPILVLWGAVPFGRRVRVPDPNNLRLALRRHPGDEDVGALCDVDLREALLLAGVAWRTSRNLRYFPRTWLRSHEREAGPDCARLEDLSP